MFSDANLDQAEAGVLAGIFAAAGQTCVAGSRAYIHQPIYDQFVDRLVRRATRITLGDPMLAATQMGPVATKMQLEKDESMVQRAVSEGAAVLCGGARPQLDEFPDGYFYQPTIVHEAGKDNFLMRNEVFGPVLAVTPFRDDAEALALANDTEFGLAAGVWTRDVNRVHKMARQLEAGTVWINTYPLSRSTHRSAYSRAHRRQNASSVYLSSTSRFASSATRSTHSCMQVVNWGLLN